MPLLVNFMLIKMRWPSEYLLYIANWNGRANVGWLYHQKQETKTKNLLDKDSLENMEKCIAYHS